MATALGVGPVVAVVASVVSDREPEVAGRGFIEADEPGVDNKTGDMEDACCESVRERIMEGGRWYSRRCAKCTKWVR